jgi:hypothetical protein
MTHQEESAVLEAVTAILIEHGPQAERLEVVGGWGDGGASSET